MNAQIATLALTARAATVVQALRTCPDQALAQAGQESLTFLIDLTLQMMHVMSHIEEGALERGIAAAEHCSAQT